MNYYIVTSDKYNFLVEGYIKLFNIHWSEDVHVNVLGFKKPDIEFPDNFSFISMGKQSSFVSWSEPLIKFFDNSDLNDDDYFFMSFEDHFLVEDVKEKLFNEVVEYMENDKNIDKVYLLKHNKKIESHYKGNFYNVSDHPHCCVTTSLLPCIWRKSFFMRLLKNDVATPWEFEEKHNPLQLNCSVLISKSVILPVVDAMRQKTFNVEIFKQFARSKSYRYGEFVQKVTQESINVFTEMYNIWKNLDGVHADPIPPPKKRCRCLAYLREHFF